MYKAAIELIQSHENESALSALKMLEKTYKNDPDLFVLKFNRFLLMSIPDSTLENLRGHEASAKSDSLKDSVKQSGFTITKSSEYSRVTFDQAIATLDSGLLMYPDRLDMHLGKSYALASAGRYGEMTTQFLRVMKIGDSISDSWRWSFSAPYVGDARDLILQSIQARIYDLWNLDTFFADSLNIALSTALTSHYSNNVYGYANLGSIHNLRQEYDQAINYYLQAFRIDSTDEVVVANMIVLYARLRDTLSSKYYMAVLRKYGSNENVQEVEQLIRELEH